MNNVEKNDCLKPSSILETEESRKGVISILIPKSETMNGTEWNPTRRPYKIIKKRNINVRKCALKGNNDLDFAITTYADTKHTDSIKTLTYPSSYLSRT